MLLQRSILLEVCLILAVTLVNARYSYDAESKPGPDGAPSFDRANYAKLFHAEASSPIVYKKSKDGGYEIPDYEKIFLPVEEASNQNVVKSESPNYAYYTESHEGTKKEDQAEPYESKIFEYPAHLKDFFENPKQQEHEESQSRDEEVVRPGPSYVSHQVPAYPSYENDEDKSASERVSSNERERGEYGGEEGRVEKDNDDYTLPKFTLEALKNNKQRVNYDTGKSSSTVSQYPEASQYPAASEFGNAAAAATPYVKYAFHPASESYQAQSSRAYDTAVGPSEYRPYSGYNSGSENDHVYETQPSEDVPTKFMKNNCKKISSEDDMNCFSCENPKTNAKYTQCSYKSNKEPVSYYEGNSAKYSMPQKGDSGRYKRYANKDEDDPYTLIKSRSLKAFENAGIPSDYSSDFQYQPEHYDETKPELTYSEQHAEEIKKNPDNCKKVDRKGMTCTVCKDPKTGGNFEQCSYTSSPQEKKYAYVTEKKYDNDEPEETKVVPETKTIEVTGESKVNPTEEKDRELREQTERIHQEKNPRKRDEESREEPNEERNNEDRNEEYQSKPSEKKPVQEAEEDDDDDDTSSYEPPSHFSSKNGGDYSGSSSEAKHTYPEYDFSDFDEYHYKLFPEFAKSESRRQPVKQTYQEEKEAYKVPDVPEPKENYQIPDATKQNVESVLAEFSKKDRSNCKKAEKKGMTCYLCVDKNNIQHEECMYVQESRPQSSHVAYHEVKAVKDKPDGIKVQQPAVAESKRKHFFKKVTTPAPVISAAASEQVGVVVALKPEEVKTEETKAVEAKPAEEASHKEKRSNSEEREEESREPKAAASDFDDESDRISEKGEPTINIPRLGTEEGVNSEETRPVYSKTLGVKLPKYMLEKSEFEQEFDDFAASF